MFQFPASPSCTLWIHVQVLECLPQVGFPIRKSTSQRLFAPNRGLSQLITSFFGSWCQGIHPMLLLAWPSFENGVMFPLPPLFDPAIDADQLRLGSFKVLSLHVVEFSILRVTYIIALHMIVSMCPAAIISEIDAPSSKYRLLPLLASGFPFPM